MTNTLLLQLSEALREIKGINGSPRTEVERQCYVDAACNRALALLTPEVLARGKRERMVVEAARVNKDMRAVYKEIVDASLVRSNPRAVSKAITLVTESQQAVDDALAALDADPKGEK